jgi:hypothetical protein
VTIVYTGIEDLDKEIAQTVGGTQAYYADYLLEEKEAKTVILSTNIETKGAFKNFLFALRRDNKRVILLAGDENSPYLGYALALGIYDLIFDPVTVDKILEIHQSPRQFSDIAHLYLGLRGRVSFEDPLPKNVSQQIEGAGDAQVAINQLYGIFQLMGKGTSKQNINEMLLDLEQILIQQLV